ncbi:hypothetical protein L6164_028174 [Bauhinia variegata]|uniref:Uncharacterized protein n=1 Tax=Bauhinia variegata TaxID=167791 RepID=A0ACB9LV59_BAUVA|nr:hypothetical protein L6164_028174 [Bauhinia variegata]
MHSPCTGEGSQPCFNGCFPAAFLSSEDSHDATSKSIINVTGSNYDFGIATCSTLHPNVQFTNPQALLSLPESYTNFTKAYPHFSNSFVIDQIRAQEYYHLNRSNICFDYTGYGLFSFAQQQRRYPKTSIASSSSNLISSLSMEPPFFDISYKSVNLYSQILYGAHESELESNITKRIMAFMKISEVDYTAVFTANQSSAFKLAADSFQFQSNGCLLTVYDHHSESVDLMIESAKKQGVNVLSAEFTWPNLKIVSGKLKKMIGSKREKKGKRGLFVFPLQSRVTGAQYPYIWMAIAQEHGWNVLLDASALAPKEMGTLGLSLIQPDFLVCSFYKVFGENPSGFGCLFVRKSSISAIKDSPSMGIVSLVPAFKHSQFPVEEEEEEEKEKLNQDQIPNSKQMSVYFETKQVSGKQKAESTSGIAESNKKLESGQSVRRRGEIECRGLDHAESVGRTVIGRRARYLINWLVNALMSLQHPHPSTGVSLIRIYGPKINFQRGTAVAFNVFDWKGEKIDPTIVQKLADRNNISLGLGILNNIDKNAPERERMLESDSTTSGGSLQKKKLKRESGISVLTAALSFLNNFEDNYRLWAFLSRFLDADFVEKEKWRYIALNQKTIEV